MDKNITASPLQKLMTSQQSTLFQQTSQQTLQQQTATAGAQFAAPKQIQQQQVLQGLLAAEQQAGQIGAAAPAPAVQEQRRKKSLKEKLAEKFGFRKQNREAERQQREEQQQRTEQERTQQERTEQEEQGGWQRERDRKVAEIDQKLREQGEAKDGNDFYKELKEDAETVWNEMSEKKQTAIREYTNGASKEMDLSYASMNHILRIQEYDEDGGKDESERVPFFEKRRNYLAVKRAISALKQSKLKKDMVVRRGATYAALMYFLNMEPSKYDDENLETLKQNMERFNRDGSYVAFDRGFLSTSPFEEGGFGAGGLEDIRGVEFFIQAHEGDEAFYIGDHSFKKEEKEMLFQAGTRFRIIKLCEGAGDNLKVYMETIPKLEPLRGADDDNHDLPPPELEQEIEVRKEAEEEQARQETEAQALWEAEEQVRQEVEEEEHNWESAQRKKIDRMNEALERQGTIEEGTKRLQEIENEKKEEERRKRKYLNTGEPIPEKVEVKRSGEEQKRREFDQFIYQSEEELWGTLLDGQEAFQAYISETPKEEGASFYSMNHILRTREFAYGEGSEEADDEFYKTRENYRLVENMIDAIKSTPLPEDLVVRRGTNLSTLLRLLGVQPGSNAAENQQLLREAYTQFNDGKHIVFDRGFLSTSPYKDGGFPTGGRNQADGVEFVIQAHKGDEAFYLGKNSESLEGDETELIFQAGTQLRVVKICPPGEEKISHGTAGSWKVYLETRPGLEPLRGKKDE